MINHNLVIWVSPLHKYVPREEVFKKHSVTEELIDVCINPDYRLCRCLGYIIEVKNATCNPNLCG